MKGLRGGSLVEEGKRGKHNQSGSPGAPPKRWDLREAKGEMFTGDDKDQDRRSLNSHRRENAACGVRARGRAARYSVPPGTLGKICENPEKVSLPLLCTWHSTQERAPMLTTHSPPACISTALPKQGCLPVSRTP